MPSGHAGTLPRPVARGKSTSRPKPRLSIPDESTKASLQRLSSSPLSFVTVDIGAIRWHAVIFSPKCPVNRRFPVHLCLSFRSIVSCVLVLSRRGYRSEKLYRLAKIMGQNRRVTQALTVWIHSGYPCMGASGKILSIALVYPIPMH